MPVPLAPVVGLILVGGFVGGLVVHRRSIGEKERQLEEITGQRVTLGIAPHDGRLTFLVEVDAVLAGVRDGQLLVSKLIDVDLSGATCFLKSDAEITEDGFALHRVRWVETRDGRRFRW